MRGKVALVPRGRGREECSSGYGGNGEAGVGYTQRAKMAQVRRVFDGVHLTYEEEERSLGFRV